MYTGLTITARHLTKSGQNCILSDQKENFPVKLLCIIYHFRNVSGHFLIVIVSTVYTFSLRSFYNVDDSNGECGVPHERKFAMPRPSLDEPW